MFSQWRDKLVTKEDPFFVHKTLGLLCLASFSWRLSLFGDAPSDMGFRSFPLWTMPTVVLHLALNMSSFEFRIPRKRITSGYRIWPEYRLHSLVFLARSLALIILASYEDTYQLHPPHYAWNVGVVFLTLVAADVSSYSQGAAYRSRSIRDLDVPEPVKLFFTVMQFMATATCLYGGTRLDRPRRYGLQFLMVIIIQGNAFLMTLRRKELLSHWAGLSVYGVVLLVGSAMALVEHFRECDGMDTVAVISATAQTVALFRIGLGWSKYPLWCLAAIVLNRYVRTGLQPPVRNQPLEVLSWLLSPLSRASGDRSSALFITMPGIILTINVLSLLMLLAYGWYSTGRKGGNNRLSKGVSTTGD